MAKRKTPEGISTEELAAHKAKDFISNHATRSEKIAWERQFTNLQRLVKRLEPIEDKMMALITEKGQIIDDLMVLRRELVETCIHPFEHLVTHDNYIICKFCEKKMAIPNDGEKTSTEA